MRGGVGIRVENDYLNWLDNYGEVKIKTSLIVPDASVGLGFALCKQIHLNLALNLANLTEADILQTLAIRTTLVAEM